MKRLFAVLSVLALTFVAVSVEAQRSEIRLGGSLTDAGGKGYGFPFWGAMAAGQVHVMGFDLGGGYTRSNFPKIGTPGGHQTVTRAHINYWFGDHVFAGIDYARVFGDATVWTKEVDFVGINVGYRFIGGPRLGPVKWVAHPRGGYSLQHEVKEGRHEDVISFAFDKEVKTDAVQPNRVNAFAVKWYHDFPLGAHQALRWGVSFSHSRFDQFVFFSDADENGLRHRLPTGELRRLGSNSMTVNVSYIFKIG